MEHIYAIVDELMDYAKKQLMLKERDELFARNSVLGALGIAGFGEGGKVSSDATSPEEILARLKKACVEEGLFDIYECEQRMDAVMGALTALPSVVEDTFSEKLKTNSEEATEWLYNYAVKSDYVKKSVLDKNPRFDTENGLVITINKAKPEFRDPKKAAAGNAVASGYPKCTICRDNEGYYNRSKRTLRTVGLNLNGRNWFWQFSPYGYFYQHGIAVNCEHTPMKVNKETFENLIDFVDKFPHYFIGCNAPLPRIGGSVLAHDHYQGGGEVLPLHKAKIKTYVKDQKYPYLRIGILDWPGTVLRITSNKRNEVVEVAERLREAWVKYTNKELGIIAEDETGIHSAISPTVIKTVFGYEMNIILRNNITTEQYPDGVFHAHPEYHAIKKESIGLIEAQGLFILPGRLEEELQKVEACVRAGELTDDLKQFALVYDEVKAATKSLSQEDVHEAMKEELGSICYRILQNTAVFKTEQQFITFLKEAGFEV